MSMRYAQSERLLERALHTIPFGNRTLSKSKTPYPRGAAPHFIEKGLGSRVWDADDNEFIDFENSQGAVLLGYRDPFVDDAVRRQMENGVSFSLPHRLEMQVSEKLTELIPCAEMVRFGKTGSDATAAALRLARVYTSRQRVAACGCHDRHDWSIHSAACRLGVPNPVQELTHSFDFNRLDTLEKLFSDYPDEFAAVILEPMNSTEPTPEFLHGIQALCRKHGTVLIFDETVTGFRFDIGGAQRLFGVTPDLATFGKGMANGYPISAVMGKRDLMMKMEDIFYPYAFEGETLSLAASLATLRRLETYPVISSIHRVGRKIMDGIRASIELHGLESVLSVTGSPSWSFLSIQDTERYSLSEIKTFYLQEMLARGILAFGAHTISYSHTDEDAARLLLAYDEFLQLLETALTRGDLQNRLRCRPLEPLF